MRTRPPTSRRRKKNRHRNLPGAGRPRARLRHRRAGTSSPRSRRRHRRHRRPRVPVAPTRPSGASKNPMADGGPVQSGSTRPPTAAAVVRSPSSARPPTCRKTRPKKPRRLETTGDVDRQRLDLDGSGAVDRSANSNGASIVATCAFPCSTRAGELRSLGPTAVNGETHRPRKDDDDHLPGARHDERRRGRGRSRRHLHDSPRR